MGRRKVAIHSEAAILHNLLLLDFWLLENVVMAMLECTLLQAKDLSILEVKCAEKALNNNAIVAIYSENSLVN
jgi:hypothetical protein